MSLRNYLVGATVGLAGLAGAGSARVEDVGEGEPDIRTENNLCRGVVLVMDKNDSGMIKTGIPFLDNLGEDYEKGRISDKEYIIGLKGFLDGFEQNRFNQELVSPSLNLQDDNSKNMLHLGYLATGLVGAVFYSVRKRKSGST